MSAPLVSDEAVIGAVGDQFALGVRLYEEGKYAEAEQALLQISDASSTVYYNLGNASFKQGKLGPAVLNWEKCLRLDPLDGECARNLEVASKLLRDAVPPDQTALPVRWLAAAVFSWPVVWLARAVAAVWLLTNGAFLALILARGRWPWLRAASISCLATFLILAAVLGLNLYRLHSLQYGILLAGEEALRSGPGEQNTALMQVHEGLKFRILNTQGEWVAVTIAGGYSGWLPEAAIGRI